MERTLTLFIFRDRFGAVLIQQQCVIDSDPLGEVCERHEASQEDGAKLRVVRNPAVERQGVKERIRGHVSPLLCNDCSDLALVLGDDGEATEKELRSLHLQDVTPDEAREIDRLYDQLLAAHPATTN
jgi:hypothetical protein